MLFNKKYEDTWCYGYLKLNDQKDASNNWAQNPIFLSMKTMSHETYWTRGATNHDTTPHDTPRH